MLLQARRGMLLLAGVWGCGDVGCRGVGVWSGKQLQETLRGSSSLSHSSGFQSEAIAGVSMDGASRHPRVWRDRGTGNRFQCCHLG